MTGSGAGGPAIVRGMWDRINAEGRPAMLELFAPGYRRHSGGATMSLEEFAEEVEERRRAFPDLATTVQDVIAEGERVVYRWETTGTQLHPYLGVPPTGRLVVARGITISRLQDGRIAEDWASWDKASVLHALGVIPLL